MIVVFVLIYIILSLVIIIGALQNFIFRDNSIFLIGFACLIITGILNYLYVLYKNLQAKKQRSNAQKEQTRQTALRLEKEKQRKLAQEKHIRECIEDFNSTLLSLEIKNPTIKNTFYKKRNISQIPAFNFSSLRKNSSYKDVSNFVVLDVETTGLHCKNDDIIEISAVRFVNKVPIDYMTTLIKPSRSIPEEITYINHITNEMIKDSPVVGNVIDSFSDYIKGYNLVGYNLEFDLKFLFVNNMDLFSESRKYYDVLAICRKHINKEYIDNYKLETVCNYYNIYRNDAHRATSDCLATGLIFTDIINEIQDITINSL